MRQQPAPEVDVVAVVLEQEVLAVPAAALLGVLHVQLLHLGADQALLELRQRVEDEAEVAHRDHRV